MKVTTTTTELESTPDEIARFYAASGLKPGDAPSPAAAAQASATDLADLPPQAPAPGGQPRFIDETVARRFLTRRPLSPEQRMVLRLIYEAHPARVPAHTLQKKTKYTPRQLAGLMGAFGRRLANTPGFQKGDNFLDWRWSDDGWHYGLPDSMRAALEAEKLV